MRLITPEATLSYPSLFQPRADQNNPDAKPKYGCCLVFGPEADLSELEKAAEETARAKWGDKFYFEGQRAKPDSRKLKYPLRTDDDGKYGEPGVMRYINIRSTTRPDVADQSLRSITEDRQDEVYPGCKVRASISPFAYDQQANKGVSFGLGNVQKLGEGTRIDGRRSADQDFEALAPAELEAAGAELV